MLKYPTRYNGLCHPDNPTAPPPLPLPPSLAVVPRPRPQGTPPTAPPWCQTATAPTRPAAPPSSSGRRRRTAAPRLQSQRSPPMCPPWPPPPQYSLNACAIATTATGDSIGNGKRGRGGDDGSSRGGDSSRRAGRQRACIPCSLLLYYLQADQQDRKGVCTQINTGQEKMRTICPMRTKSSTKCDNQTKNTAVGEHKSCYCSVHVMLCLCCHSLFMGAGSLQKNHVSCRSTSS